MSRTSADRIVNACDAAEIILGVALVLPADEVFTFQLSGLERRVLGVVGRVPRVALDVGEVVGSGEFEIKI